MKIRSFKSVSERRNFVEKNLKISLANMGVFSLDESAAARHNCENMIGVCQIPIGIAGPIKIDGKNYFIPLATTEGALVASISRGGKAITESGGAQTDLEKIGVTRAPVFKIKNLKEKKILQTFLKKNYAALENISKKSDPHLKLVKIDTAAAGRDFYARLAFDADDAMGMNMATIAAQEIVDFIEKKTKIRCLSVSGNYCADKKPSWLNFTNGRGFKVWGEVLLTQKVLREVLKTSAKKFYDVWQAKCMAGSALAGSMGFNAQFANSVAAIFLATGQDPAHVAEGSLGITRAEIEGNNLYASVYLPDLMAGTVGGGTGLATQKEALSILGIAGGNRGKNSQSLARIIAGGILAGEISLLASLAQGSLVKAHKKLARAEIL